MNKALLALVSVLLLVPSCKRAAPDTLQTGDLVFVLLPEDYDIINRGYVATATEGLIIHVAMLEAAQDGNYVIDATLARGVDRYPLDTFLQSFRLRSGKYPKMEVLRLKNNKGAEDFVEAAKEYLGAGYDASFSLDNDAYYCSELVHLVYKAKKGEYFFPEKEIDLRNADGTVSKYWFQASERFGVAVPSGRGVWTTDIYNSDKLFDTKIDILNLN